MTNDSVAESTVQHTPGPWSVVVANDGETYVCGGEPIEGNLPRPIAVMMRDDDEAMADAVLAAAVPELLAALNECLTEIGGLTPTVGLTAAYQHAKSAIAKARGEAVQP